MGYIYKDIIALAYQIKEEVKNKFGFTVNIGIGNNNLCAKMASDFEKPDKVHTLFSYEIKDKMWPLPVCDLLYVGKNSVQKLNQLGIHTIGELALANVDLLKPYFKNMAKDLIDRANGIDLTNLRDKSSSNKSISVSKTLPKDVLDIEKLKEILLWEAEEVGRTLRRQGYFTKTIAITFRNNHFFDYSHQITLSQGVHSTIDIYNEAIHILEIAWRHDAIRNIGIRLDNLTVKDSIQLDLFSGEGKIKANNVQEVLDRINDKFGESFVTIASLKRKN